MNAKTLALQSNFNFTENIWTSRLSISDYCGHWDWSIGARTEWPGHQAAVELRECRKSKGRFDWESSCNTFLSSSSSRSVRVESTHSNWFQHCRRLQITWGRSLEAKFLPVKRIFLEAHCSAVWHLLIRSTVLIKPLGRGPRQQVTS
jgi:hypothetical protein